MKKTFSFPSLPIVLMILFMQAFSSCHAQPSVRIKSNDSRLEYMGRHDSNDSFATLYWPGSSVEITFEGTAISMALKDEKGANYFYCIVDGKPMEKIKGDTTLKNYEIVSGLGVGMHTVQLFKLTEAGFGKTCFYGFNINKGAKVLTHKDHKRKIEFYGNSITCGYSLEDTLQDRGLPKYNNNYYSYAAITARHYDASYSCVAKSGIGLMISWFPIIMPEMYDRIDPEDSIRKWSFANYTPQVVMINLMQNDSWLVAKPGHEQFKARFGTKAPDETYIVNAYKSFITSIRRKYPSATIVCALGSMDATKAGSPWPGYIEKAAGSMHDSKVLTHFFAYKNASGHPKKAEQQQMADELINFIDKHVSWQ